MNLLLFSFQAFGLQTVKIKFKNMKLIGILNFDIRYLKFNIHHS